MPAHLYTESYTALHDGDLVSEAMRRMLADRVTDLPVVDDDGKLVGMFKLDRLLAALLPRAALVGYGLDLSFVGETLDQLHDKMRDIADHPVSDFRVPPDQVVHPDTPAIEIVLLIYRGAGNVPVVDEVSGRLVGMVSARDVLAALHGDGAV